MSTTTGMISVLGVSSARSVIFHAHLLDQLTDPEKFHNALSSVLKQGTEVVEKVIVSDLYRRLGLSLGDDHMEFVDAVTFAIEMTRNKPEAKILA
jgi:23S rRNA U2552 (ribose-2'-O)-methylase RlmE/FtsJ